jgi:hypothetical protein
VRVLFVLTVMAAACMPVRREAAVRFDTTEQAEGTWYKGNTHSHTLESDGDSPPEVVARWYRDHDYDFLVLSDHNVFTDPTTLSHLVDSTFLLVPGEEVTSSFEGRPVHVNGLDLPGVVDPRTAHSMVATLQANVDAIRGVDGIPHINHPNFRWSFSTEELAQVEGDRLLEIYNGHPLVHNQGGGGYAGLEEVWDALLTGGKRIYGIAVDDAHHFQGPFAPDRSNPGRGWVVVRAPALEARALVDALEAGDFYASTGVALSDVVVRTDRLEIHIEERGDFRYRTTFIGRNGAVLYESFDNPAVFHLIEDVGYVRAKVTDSMGYVAWAQPVFVTSN